jgi:hypothetical protein
MPADELYKRREIVFHPFPPGQVEEACRLLTGLEGLNVTGIRPRSIQVAYDVREYTLDGLERALAAQGFHLDNSLLQKIRRALVSFCERVQCDNLRAHPCEQNAREIFVRAYQHHPHGDRDATPEEWRSYK